MECQDQIDLITDNDFTSGVLMTSNKENEEVKVFLEFFKNPDINAEDWSDEEP